MKKLLFLVSVACSSVFSTYVNIVPFGNDQAMLLALIALKAKATTIAAEVVPDKHSNVARWLRPEWAPGVPRVSRGIVVPLTSQDEDEFGPFAYTRWGRFPLCQVYSVEQADAVRKSLIAALPILGTQGDNNCVLLTETSDLTFMATWGQLDLQLSLTEESFQESKVRFEAVNNFLKCRNSREFSVAALSWKK